MTTIDDRLDRSGATLRDELDDLPVPHPDGVRRRHRHRVAARSAAVALVLLAVGAFAVLRQGRAADPSAVADESVTSGELADLLGLDPADQVEISSDPPGSFPEGPADDAIDWSAELRVEGLEGAVLIGAPSETGVATGMDPNARCAGHESGRAGCGIFPVDQLGVLDVHRADALIWWDVPDGAAAVVLEAAERTWWQEPIGGTAAFPADWCDNETCTYLFTAYGADGERLAWQGRETAEDPAAVLGLDPADEVDLTSEAPSVELPVEFAWSAELHVDGAESPLLVGTYSEVGLARRGTQLREREHVTETEVRERVDEAARSRCTSGTRGTIVSCGDDEAVLAHTSGPDVLVWWEVPDTAAVVLLEADGRTRWQQPVDGVVAFPADWCDGPWCPHRLLALDLGGNPQGEHEWAADDPAAALGLDPAAEVDLRPQPMLRFDSWRLDESFADWFAGFEGPNLDPFVVGRFVDEGTDHLCIEGADGAGGGCGPTGSSVSFTRPVPGEQWGLPTAAVWPGLPDEAAIVVLEREGTRRWVRPVDGVAAIPVDWCEPHVLCRNELRAYDAAGELVATDEAR
ncbi:MAG: hypothetical protein S0880_20960 [Actinomycetota bacterium]|nr:hypothetical protein [Actinomycetota bacterium]